MRTIECPNCGAPATNLQNCNFCGSLLVRFADKGIDLSGTSYLDNTAVLPGLVNQLERNLSIQKTGVNAGTDMYIEDEQFVSGKTGLCFVSAAHFMGYQDDQKVFPQASGVSLATMFSFKIYKDPSIAPLEIERHKKFKELTSFPLFTTHAISGDDNGYDYVWYEYAIDFGEDALGAAKLISEVANKVYNWDLSKPLEYYTDEYNSLINIREALLPASQEQETDWKKWFYDESGQINWKRLIWIGVAIVGGLIYLLTL